MTKINGTPLEVSPADKAAMDKMVSAFGTIIHNIKARLDNPIAPIVDPHQRSRMVIELLSGAAFGLIAVDHPLGSPMVAMANRAGHIGEQALDIDLNDVVKKVR